MSFSFTVQTSRIPRLGELVAQVAEPDLAFIDEPPAGDDWPAEYRLHPYLRRRSIRGVEMSHDDTGLHVRIFSISSRADYELGLRVVEVAAELTGGVVRPEDADPMPAAELRAHYGTAWMDRMVPWGADMLLFMVEKEQKTLTFDGVRRKVHVGLQFAARLRAASDERSVEERLLDAALAIQNIDENRWYAANVLRAGPRDGDAAYTATAWVPELAYLFPAVERLGIMGAKPTIFVPASRGPEIAGEKWSYLDEANALVEATPTAEWPELRARAQQFAIR